MLLDGPAAAGAHFNLKERRNAASVHLLYPVPAETSFTSFGEKFTRPATGQAPSDVRLPPLPQ